MNEKQRIARVELSPFDRGKALDVYCREFVCSAAGKVQGNLDAETADIKGACKVGGNVNAVILKIGGSLKVTGDVKSELIRAKGAFKVEGNLTAANLRITGATKVLGKIESSEEIFVQGVLSCQSDIVSAAFNLQGAVNAKNLLRANIFTADLGGRSAIKYLEAERIRVTSSKKDSELVVKKITAKEAYLENTVAELVEAEKVIVGKGCTVSEVKAAELEVHSGSKVGKRL